MRKKFAAALALALGTAGLAAPMAHAYDNATLKQAVEDWAHSDAVAADDKIEASNASAGFAGDNAQNLLNSINQVRTEAHLQPINLDDQLEQQSLDAAKGRVDSGVIPTEAPNAVHIINGADNNPTDAFANFSASAGSRNDFIDPNVTTVGVGLVHSNVNTTGSDDWVYNVQFK